VIAAQTPLLRLCDLSESSSDVCDIAMEKIFWAAEAKRAEAVSVSVSRAPGSPKLKKSSFSEEDVNAVLSEVPSECRDF
jgi:hypothetical protein